MEQAGLHQTEQSADHPFERLPEDLAHAAVDDEVERAGETHEGVDDENDVVSNVIVQHSQYNVTAVQSVQQIDHHQWDFSQL